MMNPSVKKFLAGAVVMGLAAYALSCFGLYADVVHHIARANASVAYAILKNLDSGVNLQGDTLWSSATGEAVSVHNACIGHEIVGILAVLMLAFPAPIRSKIIGVAFASVVIAGMNLARIVSLYWISAKHPGLLDTAHGVVWPVVWNVTAVGVLVAWIIWLKKHEGHPIAIAA